MIMRSDTALVLMKMALALLDRDHVELAACHLQHAIELAEGDDGVGGILGAAPIVTDRPDTPHH